MKTAFSIYLPFFLLVVLLTGPGTGLAYAWSGQPGAANDLYLSGLNNVEPAGLAPVMVDSSPEVIDPKVQISLASSGKADFWLRLRQSANLAAVPAAVSQAGRSTYVYNSLKASAASQNRLITYLDSHGLKYERHWIVNAILVYSASSADLAALAAYPEVLEVKAPFSAQLVEPVVAVQAAAQTGAAWSGTDWGLTFTHAPQVWDSYADQGQGIVVASIDTGVQGNHPALVSHYRGTVTGDNNYNWFAPTSASNPACPGAASAPCDWNGHGTHTMGIMVGDDGVTGSAGHHTGMAPQAEWMACMGCDLASGCSSAALTTCAEWVIAPTDLNGLNPDPTKAPNIVNNSWGGGMGETWFQTFVQAWRAAGIFPTFSAGNGGPNCSTITSPGDYPEAFASGAVDVNGVVASFSSRGPGDLVALKPDLVAPGVAIWSTKNDGTYTTMSGTSMASPHSAGAVALLWSAAPWLKGNINQTVALLDSSANPNVATTTPCGGPGPGSMPNYAYGNGYLDAQALLAAAVPTVSSPEAGSAFWANNPATFHLHLTNQSTGMTFNHARLNFIVKNTNLADIASLEYLEGSIWLPASLSQSGPDVTGYIGQADGFTLGTLYDQTITVRVTWTQAAARSIEFPLVDLASAGRLLTVMHFSLPTLSSSDLGGPYIVTRSQGFNIQMTNPAAPSGGTAPHTRLVFTFKDTLLGDIPLLRYQTGSAWVDLQQVQVGNDVEATYDLAATFPLVPGLDCSIPFEMTLGVFRSYVMTVSLVDVDAGGLTLTVLNDIATVKRVKYILPVIRSG